jgi:hypothetical protein
MKKSALNSMFVALMAAMLSTVSAFAASITWNTPVTIAGDTDVATTGSLLYAYNGANSTVSVNGVSFTGANSTTTWGSVTFSGNGGSTTGAYAGSGTPWSSLSTAYKTVLQGGNYANGATAVTVTLNSLVSGHTYVVQIWVNDCRSGEATRTETVTSSGGNTVTLAYNSTQVQNGVGQYTIGTFTASATTQTFTLTGNASTQLNAIQVRDTATAGPVSATTSTVVASPTSVAADGSTTSTVTVTLKDASNLPVSGKTVTLAQTSGPGTPTITTVSGTTSGAGVATFTVKSTTV